MTRELPKRKKNAKKDSAFEDAKYVSKIHLSKNCKKNHASTLIIHFKLTVQMKIEPTKKMKKRETNW